MTTPSAQSSKLPVYLKTDIESRLGVSQRELKEVPIFAVAVRRHDER